MGDKRLTVADVLALKGKRQLSMVRVESLEEGEAAEKAGIDMLSRCRRLCSTPAFREAVPDLLRVRRPRIRRVSCTAEDYLRAAFAAIRAGGDAV